MRSGSADTSERHAIVERLYDVAVDPVCYENLLDAWEAEHLHGQTGVATRSIVDRLDAHVQRAAVFLDRYEQVSLETVEQDLKRHIPFSAIAIDKDFAVIASNFENRNAAFPTTRSLSDIPFLSTEAVADVRRLAQQVFRTGKVVIQPLPTGEGPPSGIMLVRLHLAADRVEPPTVVAVFSRVRWDREVETRLQEKFGFSSTETQIVRLMTEMNGRKEIAKIRNRSVETIKRHLSSIFQKTGCRSSSELVVLITSFINLISDESSSIAAEQSGLRSVTVVRSGVQRRANFVAAGALHGRACIHLPGPYCLSQWPEPAERAATAERVRLITPIRAGYGPAPLPKRSGDAASRVVGEILTVMDALDIDRAPFVTQSNDVVFAFRFARQHPDRISAIIACGGAPPMHLPEHYDRMDKWHRFVLANAKFAPRLFPFIVKAGFMLARRIGTQHFLERVYANAPGDMEVIQDPVCRDAIVNGSRFALSEYVSADAAFAESICCFGKSDWTSDLAFAEGRVPVHFVNGSDDPMTPPSTLEEFRLAYPWIKMHVHEHAGEFVFFRHWRSVMNLIHQHL